jgi:hypothetical protein
MGTKRSAPLDHCSTEGRKPSTSRDKLPFYVVDLGHLVKKKKAPICTAIQMGEVYGGKSNE